ncbi:MAG: hypothetical protein KA435_00720 [Azonexus sp.]|nr:hypothetical protein [Azonexus sp.]MBP6201554.1 hypothetical protein [Azonexus sp.]
MPSPIIARADALMHRRRQTDSEFDDVPVLTDSVDEFDDIPVLTEVEPLPEAEIISEPLEELATEHVTELTCLAAPETPATLDPILRDELVRELAGRIEERIKAALPEIISSTLRDFLADQEMIENS